MLTTPFHHRETEGIMGNDCATEHFRSCTHQLRSSFRGHQSKDTATYRRFSMRFSVNIILLAWAYPKPSVSMSSSEVVTLGGTITIHCKSEGQQQAEFSLEKQKGYSLHRRDKKKAEQNKVIFTISNVSQSDAGIYRCIYCFPENSIYDRCSDYSDEVHLNISDPRLAKPSINVRPEGPLAPGLNVTIECQGPRNALKFFLYKSKVLRASQVTQPNGNRAKFIEKTEEAASYTCRYSLKENSFIWSEPSDPVELIARGKETDQPMTIIWAGCAAGLLLVLLLLLLAFVLYQKRRKGSTAKERNQPANMPLEAFISTDHNEPIYSSPPDEITYAILNQHSLKAEQVAGPDKAPEPCIYASLAKDRIQED